MRGISRAEAEARLWEALGGGQLGVRFRRKATLGVYRVEFVCVEALLIVDLGTGLPAELLAQRNRWLEGQGFTVLLITPEAVLSDLGSVLVLLRAHLPAALGESRVKAVVVEAPAAPTGPSFIASPIDCPPTEILVGPMRGRQGDSDESFMRHALALAERAALAGEVPVGAVLVRDGVVVAEGWNRPIVDCDPSAHAEMVALRAGGTALQNYRMPGTTLYVTLEPCVMCAGAILHARVSRLVFGARDPKAGAVDSVYDVIAHPRLNHRLEWVGGVLEEDCGERLRNFFRERRGG